MPTNKNAQLRYRYEVSDFRLFNNGQSTEEMQTLRSTISMLGRYRGYIERQPINHQQKV